jgi:non-specific protein-tyrosine kinase
MNLRRALDEAEKARKGGVKPAIVRTGAAPQKTPQSEWKPPVYCESAARKIDPSVLCANRCICIEPEVPELDHYKVLRTRIQQATQSGGRNVIMITSPGEREGKSTTTINLALTFAKAYNQTVLMVDCDLRRQAVHKLMGIESEVGLVDYLMDQRPLSDLMIWPGVEKLTIISGGRTIQNSTELLGSQRMKALVAEMKTRYPDRFVLLDAPPVLLGADTLALAPLVDGIVLVVVEGRTAMRDIRKALEVLPEDKLLGLVMNRQRKRKRRKTASSYHY